MVTSLLERAVRMRSVHRPRDVLWDRRVGTVSHIVKGRGVEVSFSRAVRTRRVTRAVHV